MRFTLESSIFALNFFITFCKVHVTPNWSYENTDIPAILLNVPGFLQKVLYFLPVRYPFLVRNSNDVCAFLRCHDGSTVLAFSLDVKCRFFSLPQVGLLDVVHDRIYEVGVVQFQNKIGYCSGVFLELLRACLQSLMVNFEGSRYIQKDARGDGHSPSFK